MTEVHYFAFLVICTMGLLYFYCFETTERKSRADRCDGDGGLVFSEGVLSTVTELSGPHNDDVTVATGDGDDDDEDDDETGSNCQLSVPSNSIASADEPRLSDCSCMPQSTTVRHLSRHLCE